MFTACAVIRNIRFVIDAVYLSDFYPKAIAFSSTGPPIPLKSDKTNRWSSLRSRLLTLEHEYILHPPGNMLKTLTWPKMVFPV